MGYLTLPEQYKEILGMTADDYAKQQTAGLNAQNQQYLTDYEKVAEQRKNALNTNKQNTIQQIQQRIPEIEQQAKSQSKQAYINNMLAQKDMGQRLSQAGLSTTGVVGSAYGDLSNAYGENVNKISLDKTNAIRNVNNEVDNANMQYSQKEQELLAEIEATKIDMNKYNNQLSLQQYQAAIDNYMKYKQIEEYVNNFNMQKEESDKRNRQWQAEQALREKQWQAELDEIYYNRQQREKEGTSLTSSSNPIVNSNGGSVLIKNPTKVTTPSKEFKYSDYINMLRDEQSYLKGVYR